MRLVHLGQRVEPDWAGPGQHERDLCTVVQRPLASGMNGRPGLMGELGADSQERRFQSEEGGQGGGVP